MKYSPYLILMFLLSVSFMPSLANNSGIAGSKDKKALAKHYYHLALKYVMTHPDSAIYYGKKQQLLAKELDDDNLLAKAFDILGYAYTNKKSFDTAAQYYYKGLDLLKDKSGRLFNIRKKDIYSGLGLVYERIYNYDLALKYYSESLKLAKKENNKKHMALLTYNLAIGYKMKGNLIKAKKYYLLAINRGLKINGFEGITKFLNSLGNLYFEENQFDSARFYYLLALEKSQNIKSLASKRASYLGNIGECYYHQNQFDLAKAYYFKALPISEKFNDTKRVKWLNYDLANLYCANHNYRKAITHYEKIIELGDTSRIDKYYKLSCKKLSDLYNKLGDYKRSLVYNQKYLVQIEKIGATKSTLSHRNNQYFEEQSKWAIKEYLLLILACTFLVFVICITIGIIHHRRTVKGQTDHGL